VCQGLGVRTGDFGVINCAKRSQLGGRWAPAIADLGFGIADSGGAKGARGDGADAAWPFVQNKANCPRFGAENED